MRDAFSVQHNSTHTLKSNAFHGKGRSALRVYPIAGMLQLQERLTYNNYKSLLLIEKSDFAYASL